MGKLTSYETVEDSRDLRIPVQSEEAFEHGIEFKCKYVGTEEIPRPNSRVEIVAAMRRIRYEHKYRNIKKRKILLSISADGILVALRKKKKKDTTFVSNDSHLSIMQYPINRVFYVSHDSQDLKILSFIARGEDGIFRCSVFKALKKSQAMHMVRTIGQAFEVCHKINTGRTKPDEPSKPETEEETSSPEKTSEKAPEETDIDEMDSEKGDDEEDTKPLPATATATLVTDLDAVKDSDLKELPPPLMEPTNHVYGTVLPPLLSNGQLLADKHGPFSLQELQQLYHQQLLHQIQDAEASRREVTRLRDLLKAEELTRTQAQSQVHRLLAQNRELIVIVQRLMGQLNERFSNENSQPINDSWMLSSMAQNVLTTNNGVGPTSMDYNSEIFDNSNVAASPIRLPPGQTQHHQLMNGRMNKPMFLSNNYNTNNKTNMFGELVNEQARGLSDGTTDASSNSPGSGYNTAAGLTSNVVQKIGNGTSHNSQQPAQTPASPSIIPISPIQNKNIQMSPKIPPRADIMLPAGGVAPRSDTLLEKNPFAHSDLFEFDAFSSSAQSQTQASLFASQFHHQETNNNNISVMSPQRRIQDNQIMSSPGRSPLKSNNSVETSIE